MNKKAVVNTFTFLIIIVSLIFVLIIGTKLVSNLSGGFQDSLHAKMITNLRNNIDSLLYDGAGATISLTIRPSTKVTNICFVDYDKTVFPTGIMNVQQVVEQIQDQTDLVEKPNLIIVTKDGFETFYIGSITVNPHSPTNGINCSNYKPKIDLILKSEGKKVLITEK